MTSPGPKEAPVLPNVPTQGPGGAPPVAPEELPDLQTPLPSKKRVNFQWLESFKPSVRSPIAAVTEVVSLMPGRMSSESHRNYESDRSVAYSYQSALGLSSGRSLAMSNPTGRRSIAFNAPRTGDLSNPFTSSFVKVNLPSPAEPNHPFNPINPSPCARGSISSPCSVMAAPAPAPTTLNSSSVPLPLSLGPQVLRPYLNDDGKLQINCMATSGDGRIIVTGGSVVEGGQHGSGRVSGAIHIWSRSVETQDMGQWHCWDVNPAEEYDLSTVTCLSFEGDTLVSGHMPVELMRRADASGGSLGMSFNSHSLTRTRQGGDICLWRLDVPGENLEIRLRQQSPGGVLTAAKVLLARRLGVPLRLATVSGGTVTLWRDPGEDTSTHMELMFSFRAHTDKVMRWRTGVSSLLPSSLSLPPLLPSSPSRSSLALFPPSMCTAPSLAPSPLSPPRFPPSLFLLLLCPLLLPNPIPFALSLSPLAHFPSSALLLTPASLPSSSLLPPSFSPCPVS